MTSDIIFRMVVVSDGHINHDSSNAGYHNTAASTITDWHNNREVDVLVYNGDTSQDSAAQQELDEEFFDLLPSDIPCYVSYGNHEYIQPEEWPDWYGHETDHSFEYAHGDGGKFGGLVVQSAEPPPGREYDTPEACPDVNFIESELDSFEADSDIDGVFVFCHVPPAEDLGDFANDCPDVRDEFARHIVRAVFIGHEHSTNDYTEAHGARYYYTNHLGNRGSGVTGIRRMDVKND